MSETDGNSVRRFGQVIGLRPESVEAYKALHAGPGVRHLLRQANIRNFCIFLHKMDDGRFLEFAYFEYTGADFAADMAWLAAQPDNQAWLAMCDPMQIPLAGEKSWAAMEEIYFND
jgi:L-rhamnose mutarotase